MADLDGHDLFFFLFPADGLSPKVLSGCGPVLGATSRITQQTVFQDGGTTSQPQSNATLENTWSIVSRHGQRNSTKSAELLLKQEREREVKKKKGGQSMSSSSRGQAK
jgi:hypothetical protein